MHYCSQQRGFPAKPLEQYSKDDIRREYVTEKSCAPYCTVSCIHQVSYMDHWRSPQTIRAGKQEERPSDRLVQIG